MLTNTNHTISWHLRNVRRQCSVDALCWGFSKAITYGFIGVAVGLVIAVVKIISSQSVVEPQDDPTLPTFLMLGTAAGAMIGFFKGFINADYYNRQEQRARHRNEEQREGYELINLLTR